jgi:hypothetical protein
MHEFDGQSGCSSEGAIFLQGIAREVVGMVRSSGSNEHATVEEIWRRPDRDR